MMPVCGNHLHYCASFLLQTQLRKIRKQICTGFWKVMCVWSHSSKEAFCFYWRNLPILGRSLLICGAAAAQTYIQKYVSNVSIIFLMHNILLTASSFTLSNKRIYIEPTEGRYSVEGVGTSQWCPKCAQSSHSLGTQMTINTFSNQNNSWF